MSAVRGPGFRLRSRRRVRVSRRIPDRRIPDPNSLLPQAGWRGCQTHSALNYPRRSNVALESARPLANGFEFPMPVPAHHRESNNPVRIPGTWPPLPMQECRNQAAWRPLHRLSGGLVAQGPGAALRSTISSVCWPCRSQSLAKQRPCERTGSWRRNL